MIKDVMPVISTCLPTQIEKTIEIAFASTIDCAVNKAIEKFKTDVMQPMLNMGLELDSDSESEIGDNLEPPKPTGMMAAIRGPPTWTSYTQLW